MISVFSRRENHTPSFAICIHPIFPIIIKGTSHRCSSEPGLSRMSIIFQYHHNLIIISDYCRWHSITAPCTITNSFLLTPGYSSVKTATQWNLLLIRCGERCFICKIKMNLSRRELKEGRLPTTIFKCMTGIIDKYRITPCLTIIRASDKTYAEPTLCGIWFWRTWIIAHKNSAIRKLNQVGHCSRQIRCRLHNLLWSAPCISTIATITRHYTSTFTYSHQPFVLKLDNTRIVARREYLLLRW